MAVISIATVSIAETLSLLNNLSILALLLLLNFATGLGMFLWKRQILSVSDTFKVGPANENGTKKKVNLDNIDNPPLKSRRDSQAKDHLLTQKRVLQNELRRIESSLERYGLARPPLKRSGIRVAARTRVELKIDAMEKKNLEQILNSALSVVSNEPLNSMANALEPIANCCRAHYNLIKRQGTKKSQTLSDYWVAWCLIFSVVNGSKPDSRIMAYVSKEFRQKVNSLQRSIMALDLSQIKLCISRQQTANDGDLGKRI